MPIFGGFRADYRFLQRGFATRQLPLALMKRTARDTLDTHIRPFCVCALRVPFSYL